MSGQIGWSCVICGVHFGLDTTYRFCPRCGKTLEARFLPPTEEERISLIEQSIWGEMRTPQQPEEALLDGISEIKLNLALCFKEVQRLLIRISKLEMAEREKEFLKKIPGGIRGRILRWLLK